MKPAQKINLSAIMSSHDNKIEETTPAEESQTQVEKVQEAKETSPVTNTSSNQEKKVPGIKSINLNAIKKESTDIKEVTENKNTVESKKQETVPETIVVPKAEKIKKVEVKMNSEGEENTLEGKETSNIKLENKKDIKEKEEVKKVEKSEIKTKIQSEKENTKKEVDTSKNINSKGDQKDIKEEVCDVEKKECSTNTDKEAPIGSGEVFVNYESDFKKKAPKIAEKIRHLRNMPKTNFIFLSLIIMMFVVGVSGLMLISPDNERYQSVNNIKASILGIIGMNKEDLPIIENPYIEPELVIETIPDPIEEIPVSENTISETVTPPEKEKGEFDLGGYKIDVAVKTGSGGVNLYEYKGQSYTTKEELNDAIMIELPKLKKEKLENVLLEIFSK